MIKQVKNGMINLDKRRIIRGYNKSTNYLDLSDLKNNNNISIDVKINNKVLKFYLSHVDWTIEYENGIELTLNLKSFDSF